MAMAEVFASHGRGRVNGDDSLCAVHARPERLWANAAGFAENFGESARGETPVHDNLESGNGSVLAEITPSEIFPLMSTKPPHRPLVWVAQSWWVDEIYEGIAAVASEKGWRLDSRMRWDRGSPPVAPVGVDGVIVFTGGSEPLVEAMKKLRVPVVDIETYADWYGAPKVISHDEPIGEIAALHLSACEPVRLVLLCPKHANEITAARRTEFRSGAAKVGLPVVETTLADFDPRALTESGRIGVFAVGDSLAVEAIHRCLSAGVDVPGRVFIVGADDNRVMCETAPVPLSSVNMGFQNKGRVAAELLDRLMRGESAPKSPVVVPVSGVTLRASTACVVTGHAELDRLARHFRENAHRPVGVDTLCGECGVAVRTASHLLRTKLDTTPLALLDDCRLTLARRFSATGKLTREAVAHASGFPSLAALVRAERTVGAGDPPG
jgi:LacI family transcriptional regulator